MMLRRSCSSISSCHWNKSCFRLTLLLLLLFAVAPWWCPGMLFFLGSVAVENPVFLCCKIGTLLPEDASVAAVLLLPLGKRFDKRPRLPFLEARWDLLAERDLGCSAPGVLSGNRLPLSYCFELLLSFGGFPLPWLPFELLRRKSLLKLPLLLPVLGEVGIAIVAVGEALVIFCLARFEFICGSAGAPMPTPQSRLKQRQTAIDLFQKRRATLPTRHTTRGHVCYLQWRDRR